MGMLGALAGAGRGMQGYAQVMRENQKLDWQSKQSEVMHERELNLQRLRDSQANAILDKQQDFTAQQNADTRKFNLEQQELANTKAIELEGLRDTNARERMKDEATIKQNARVARIGEDGTELSYAQLAGMSDEELKKTYSKGDYEILMTERKIESSLKMNQKVSAEVAKAKAQNLREALQADGSLSPTDNLKIMLAEKQLTHAEVFGSGKTMTPDMLKQLDTQLSRDETYLNADPLTQMNMTIELHNRLLGGGASGGSLNYNPEVDIPKIKSMNPDDQKIYMDQIKARDVELYRKVSRDLSVASQNKIVPHVPAGPDRGPGALQYGGSQVDEDYSYRQKLQALKKETPGMTDLWYQSKLNKG